MGYDVENTAGKARGCHPDREQSQPTLSISYEHIEIFTKDLEVRRNLGNRASPVNRAQRKRAYNYSAMFA